MRRKNAWRYAAVVMSWFCAVPILAQEQDTEHVLFQAIRRGDAALLKDLLRRGTPPGVRASDGTTPLMAASLHGSAEMVELLLKHGADPRAANDRDVTALLWGATDAQKVRLLLAAGADPNAASKLGNTPLMVAAGAASGSAAAKQLVAHGADITLRNRGGRTPLRIATSAGDVETVRLFIAKARQLDKLDKVIRDAGPTVAVASNYGFHEIVKLLLENGANANQKNGSRGPGINRALMGGHLDVARTLIEHGVSLKERSQPDGTPAVMLAAYTESDDPAMVELLREQGADCTAVNGDKETALTWARMRGHRSLAEALVEAGVPEGKMPTRPKLPARAIDLGGENQAQLITQAVQKSVDLLQLSSDTFFDIRRNCTSCHHHNLPSVALAWARDRGFHVRQASLDRMIERQVKSWQPRIGRSYELDSPFPVPPRFLGWGMWSFAELGYQPDELTRAVSWYLAATQQADGRWEAGMLRPPMGGNNILATALAMRSLQLYPLTGQEKKTAQHVDRARSFLQEAQPRTHLDEVNRMMGLAWAGVEPEALADERKKLLTAQRDDGGWSQLPGLESDAWATGQTLVVLQTAGGLPTDNPAYQRGVEMLLKTQFDDGSWYVQARSWPFQPYFESKFPHGRDQWISAPATAWAAMALMLAVDPVEVARHNAPRVADELERPGSPSEAPKKLVAAATREVDFAKDVQPIIARSCLGCHGEKNPKSNFSLTSRAALLRGGDSELPAITPGDSAGSPLVRFAAGLEQKMEMPPLTSRDKFQALSDKEIAVLRAWIDRGAEWPADKRGR